ncbi:uncharacterized protein LOC116339034 [Contarinia nasturtii]|uniref:uncharacterized protein LOC116339034 n=1 Tax=Contarinia nasturtii TaxID=265458 RepID=UPI0012D4B1FA|nr:uncharacterized protein LOC116339034 [Contarinia nasturtii]XP_031620502.1 uncharacterized protein LOC116339034 [Contarinia nasturtii]XP_031620504.1 uncharacterized protein LOC116339034 [Contarinia nasturtii]
MYDDVLHIFKMQHEKQEKLNRGSAPTLNCLAFAACYKLNTEAQLEYGLQLWNKLHKEKQLFQSGSLLGMLAINMGQPNIALEILKSCCLFLNVYSAHCTSRLWPFHYLKKLKNIFPILLYTLAWLKGLESVWRSTQRRKKKVIFQNYWIPFDLLNGNIA